MDDKARAAAELKAAGEVLEKAKGRYLLAMRRWAKFEPNRHAGIERDELRSLPASNRVDVKKPGQSD